MLARAGGRRAIRLGGRHLAPVLDALPETGRIVLFLRAFSDDQGFARMPSGHKHGPWAADPTPEELQIARAVAPFGKMVALGKPSDSTPQVGAGRHYASDGTWREQVLAGPGRSLRWEVEQVLAREEPERLVLVIVRDVAQWESFKTTMQDAFPRGLPDYEEVKPNNNVAEDAFVRAVAWFDADWTPHVAQLSADSDAGMLIEFHRWVETAFPLALRPVYERAGLAMPGLPSGPRARPWAVPAAVAAQALTAVAGAWLFSLSADSGSEFLLILLLVIALPGLLLYRVWRGGYLSSLLARGIGLFFGGVFAFLCIAVGLVDGWNATQLVGLSLSTGLLTGGLLLCRKDVREWTAALVLHRPAERSERPSSPPA